MKYKIFIATFEDKDTGSKRKLRITGFGETYSDQFDNASDKGWGLCRRNEFFSKLEDE